MHEHLHRRDARAGNPFAWASAIASALPNPFAEAEPSPDPAQTLVSIVYVTASPTFHGPIGGYTTMTAPATSSTPHTTAQSSSSKMTSSLVAETTLRSSTGLPASSSVADPTLHSSTGLPSSIVPTVSSSVASSIPLLAATSSLSQQNTPSTTAANAASATSTPTAVVQSGGLSAGGKAGIAIGLLLLFGAVLALALFFFKKRKDALAKQRLDDEKTEVFPGASFGRAASTRTTVTAPRLSLRPVTQFLPNIGEKRQSRGNALALAPTTTHRVQDASRSNPFGNHAEVIDSANASGPAIVENVSPAGEMMSAGAATAGVVGLARGASKRAPNHLDFTMNNPARGPPSPAGTEYSGTTESSGTPMQSSSAAAIAAAGGPANSTVHRVQLDFKPSMEDELELHAGQLIRLLHEYDDGWALCIRLDRSRQGVVPRTCLSTRPVKPRPQQNSPRGRPPPGMRVPGQQPGPMSPGMRQQHSMSPGMQGGPAMSPAGRSPQQGGANNGPQYTPQGPNTPAGQRSRSNSAAQMEDRRMTPPGPSPMNPQTAVRTPVGSSSGSNISRKPVGHAL